MRRIVEKYVIFYRGGRICARIPHENGVVELGGNRDYLEAALMEHWPKHVQTTWWQPAGRSRYWVRISHDEDAVSGLRQLLAHYHSRQVKSFGRFMR